MEQWLKDAYNQIERMPEAAKTIRELAKNDLPTFAKLVNPGYVYGEIHKEFYQWISQYNLYGMHEELSANKLIMLPRAHLKSHMVATWCAWMIVRHPEITIFYVSATAELATTQLGAIKNILESAVFQRFFPEYINPQEGRREKWTEAKIHIDHPRRRQEGIRDATVATAGLTTNTTGWHADVIVGDDLVVPENAYTERGREEVVKKASQFTSIRNAGGFTLACGTRYHPSDIYATWEKQTYEIYDEDGVIQDHKLIWDIKRYAVEEDGRFIWPRTTRADGKAFGFDLNTLARIRGEYEDQVQYYAQYYNNPNDPGSARITEDRFQYYDQKFLTFDGNWWYHGKKLNVYAAVDFAFALSKRADYTAIVVIGIDADNNIYVLDIDRFKTDRTLEYYRHITLLHSKWSFRKLRAEVTAAQSIIVNDIKDFIKKEGMGISVDEYRPSKHEGTKQERIAAALESRYENLQMWHFRGGYTPVLEEELMQARPAHDDVKDSLASAVEIAVKPAHKRSNTMGASKQGLPTHSRFGGITAR